MSIVRRELDAMCEILDRPPLSDDGVNLYHRTLSHLSPLAVCEALREAFAELDRIPRPGEVRKTATRLKNPEAPELPHPTHPAPERAQ